MLRGLGLAGLVLGGALGLAAAGGRNVIDYPQARRVGHTDVYHGTTVADPYRWLENDVRKSKEVADWVAAQNELTQGYLEAIPRRKKIRERLAELWNYARYTAPR